MLLLASDAVLAASSPFCTSVSPSIQGKDSSQFLEARRRQGRREVLDA